MHQNGIASLRAVATIALPCPRRVQAEVGHQLAAGQEAAWGTDGGDLGVEELDVTDPGVDGLALLERQLHPGSPPAALTPNRSEHGGLPCSRRCSKAWTSLFAR